MAKVALCIIATGKYNDFVRPLMESAEKYFLQSHEIHYHLFTNKLGIPPIPDKNKVRMHVHPIDHQPWPAMTLNRYAFILSAGLHDYDFVYYIDADSLFVAPVGDEILKDMIVVSHPGYYTKGGGSWENNKSSIAFTPFSMRRHYVCGGFQGGRFFLQIAADLRDDILIDASDGITAIWHDESHLNSVYSENEYNFTRLDCSYMMPESIEKRKAWHINHIEPKILALEKDHKNYQK